MEAFPDIWPMWGHKFESEWKALNEERVTQKPSNPA